MRGRRRLRASWCRRRDSHEHRAGPRHPHRRRGRGHRPRGGATLSCLVVGCPRARRRYGMCDMHSHQWRKSGIVPTDPKPRRVRGLDAAIVAYTSVDPSGCHPWTGPIGLGGYGQIGGDSKPAHRVIYERTVGPVPTGLVLDHMCHNAAAARGECMGGAACLHRRCVNVAHLVPTTSGENSRRGLTGSYGRSREVCPSGHPYSEGNTGRSNGRRYCRTCKRQQKRDSRARQAA